MLDYSVAVAVQGRNATAVLVSQGTTRCWTTVWPWPCRGGMLQLCWFLRGPLDVGLQCGHSRAGEECYSCVGFSGDH